MIRTLNLARMLALAAALAVTLYYGVIFGGSLPDHRLIVGYNDIILHAGAFGLVAFLVCATRRATIMQIAAIVALAGAIELAQVFDGGRTASLGDFLASLTGIAAGWLLGRAVIHVAGAAEERS